MNQIRLDRRLSAAKLAVTTPNHQGDNDQSKHDRGQHRWVLPMVRDLTPQ